MAITKTEYQQQLRALAELMLAVSGESDTWFIDSLISFC